MLSRSKWGFDDNAKIIHLFKDDKPLKAHSDYKAAKAGDLDAACLLVEQLLSSTCFVDSVQSEFKDEYFLLPIVAEELHGDNAIPMALAANLAKELRVKFFDGCVQTNKAYHTGADPMERLISRATFGGKVIAGKNYVLIDDVTAMGSTLADCASYIAENGGTVIGCVVLTNASRSGKLKAVPKDITLINERYHEDIKNLFSIDPSALTFDEARYLVGFKTADELRTRATKAENERKNRIASKKISQP